MITPLMWDLALPLEGRDATAILVGQRTAQEDRAALERLLALPNLTAEELAWVKAELDAQPGTTLFVASTDTPDRAMDVVKQDWRLANYRANPVVLDNHMHLRVVGKALSAIVPRTGDDAGKLMIRVQWDQDSPDPSVRNVGHQHLNGFRKAGSVGFRHGKKTRRHELPKDNPHYTEPKEVEGWWGKELVSGWLFEHNELLEHSSATIPMNAEALQRAVKSLVVGADRVVAPSPEGRDRIREVLLEIVKDPAARKVLFAELVPELKSLMRSDPEIRRIVSAYSEARPAAPTPSNRGELGLFERVALLL